jgi:hypothetical protein
LYKNRCDGYVTNTGDIMINNVLNRRDVSGQDHRTLIKKKIFLVYKELQKGSGAKSYMTNGLLIQGGQMKSGQIVFFR